MIDMTIQEKIKDFDKNDWRQVSMQYKKEPKHGYTPKYLEVINYIKDTHQDVPFAEAVFMLKTGQERQSCVACGLFNVFRQDPQPMYNVYCSHKCRSADKNTTAEPIIIDGVEYDNFVKASEAINVSRFLIRHRLFDPTFPNYKWKAEDHDKKCLEKLKESHPKMIDEKYLQQWKESGKTRKWLADDMNLTAETIDYALTFFEIERQFSQISKEAEELKNDPELLRSLYSEFTSDELAVKYNISPSAILQWMKIHGIEADKSTSQSAIERHLIEFIKSMDDSIEILDRDRTAIGKELDIYIPSANLAIECDGLFYHSEEPTTADKNKHSIKQRLCEEKGITLLRFVDVGETGDSNKLKIIKSILMAKLGMTIKIHGRKCNLVDVDSSAGSNFFRENHISGNRGASMYIGLEYENELVMCMSFGRPISSRSHEWEIVRMAAKRMTTVFGGSSKIFKEFLRRTSGDVMTYANLRFGNGSVYEKLGFTKIGRTDPGYMYTDMKTTYSRHKFQKQSIQSVCKIYDPNKTEQQNAEINGYRVYWDCGHAIYELKR
jgi:hypothetical protein